MDPIRHEESERMPMTLVPNRPLPEASFDAFDGVICRGRQEGMHTYAYYIPMGLTHCHPQSTLPSRKARLHYSFECGPTLQQ
jgi:hypothetical protein